MTMPAAFKANRFGHVSVVVSGNIMVSVGGYRGNVLGDLIAYKVPPAVAISIVRFKIYIFCCLVLIQLIEVIDLIHLTFDVVI